MMITNILLNFVLFLVDSFVNAIDWDLSVQQIIVANITEVSGWVVGGCRILAAYTDFSYLLSLFGICMVISAFFNAYKVVLWVLRKIPFIHIS